ncbi:hypothetical protein T265_15694, partial [Opisthorchis viverrini]
MSNKSGSSQTFGKCKRETYGKGYPSTWEETSDSPSIKSTFKICRRLPKCMGRDITQSINKVYIQNLPVKSMFMAYPKATASVFVNSIYWLVFVESHV